MWIEDLLASRAAMQQVTCPLRILGIDVGTGASCIYPLLGHAACGWEYVATELDADSLKWAEHNVTLNALSKAITLSPAHASTDVLASVIRHLRLKDATASSAPDCGSPQLRIFASNDPKIEADDVFACWGAVCAGQRTLRADFTMCNPPFFASWKEAQASMAGAAHKSVCTGSPSEMVRA